MINQVSAWIFLVLGTIFSMSHQYAAVGSSMFTNHHSGAILLENLVGFPMLLKIDF